MDLTNTVIRGEVQDSTKHDYNSIENEDIQCVSVTSYYY